MTAPQANCPKVLLVNDHAANGGIGKYVFHLFNEFMSMQHEDYSFHLLMQNMRKNYSSSTPDTYVQYRFPWAKQAGFGKLFGVMAYYYYPKKIPEGFSLYHISSQMMGKSVHYVSPAVATCHDLISFKVKSNHPRFNQYFRRKQIAALTKASAIIFISAHTKNDFLSLFDYKEEDTAIIYHAASEIFHYRDKLSCREDLGLPLERPIILHVGSEQLRKNIGTLLRTVHKIKKQVPDILLVRIGGQRKSSRKLVEILCLEQNILYPKNQPDEALAKFYNAADVFLFPSLYEGFGFPALEALKSGCPLVASDATSIPEITWDAAILHHPLDIDGFAHSIETILDNPSTRDEYVRKGIERAKHFSWGDSARKTLDIYRRVLEK